MEGITVIIPTYNRPEILAGAIARIGSNLHYHLGFPRRFLIGNDGEPGLDKYLRDIFGSDAIRVLEGPKRGLGANLNMLINACETDLIFQMDDDHYLQESLDVRQFADDLMDFKNQVGWIRLFLGTEEDLTNDDPFYSFYARLHGRYWYPEPDDTELYIASNRPHLKRKDFHEFYGMYPEDVPLGKTEEAFCHQYNDKHVQSYGKPRPWIVIPMAAPSFDTWAHVGDSWQKQGL